jgi:hypothetical protein
LPISKCLSLLQHYFRANAAELQYLFSTGERKRDGIERSSGRGVALSAAAA